MFINSETAARTWLASWNGQGGPRPGILAATISGLETALAIMTGAPQRYSEAERDETRAALRFLRSPTTTTRAPGFWLHRVSDPQTQPTDD